MRTTIEAIADSLESELGFEQVVRHRRPWRNPEEGAVVAVYGTRRIPGEWRTTATREDILEVVVEYSEPNDAAPLTRNAEAELDLHDVADALVGWADSHQSLDAVHRLDYVEARYGDEGSREAFVRYVQVILQARKVATYG